MLRDRTDGPITLSEADGRMAQRASKALARVTHTTMQPYLHFSEMPEDVAIPSAALPLITQILDALSKGERIRILAEESELTPQKAAALLGISRPLLMSILQRGIISHHRVGSHYRVLLKDVLAYQAEKERSGILLDELTAQAQEQDTEY